MIQCRNCGRSFTELGGGPPVRCTKCNELLESNTNTKLPLSILSCKFFGIKISKL